MLFFFLFFIFFFGGGGGRGVEKGWGKGEGWVSEKNFKKRSKSKIKKKLWERGLELVIVFFLQGI